MVASNRSGSGRESVGTLHSGFGLAIVSFPLSSFSVLLAELSSTPLSSRIGANALAAREGVHVDDSVRIVIITLNWLVFAVLRGIGRVDARLVALNDEIEDVALRRIVHDGGGIL